MKIYHGSTEIVKRPMERESQRFLDFGKAFYCTSSRQQAEKWAQIKQKREGDKAEAIVSEYEFDENLLQSARFSSKIFDEANEAWLDFVMLNRTKQDVHHYDIVMGAVANDTLYRTLSLYETGILTKQETIVRLKTNILFDQIAFCTQRAMDEVVFISAYRK